MICVKGEEKGLVLKEDEKKNLGRTERKGKWWPFFRWKKRSKTRQA